MAAEGKSDEAKKGSISPASVRSRLAQVVWFLCVAAAVILAAGALCVALEANRDNGLVSLLLSGADNVDLGAFSREGGIKEFTGDNAETKNALFNWGLGAIVWLVIGKVLDRVIRP